MFAPTRIAAPKNSPRCNFGQKPVQMLGFKSFFTRSRLIVSIYMFFISEAVLLYEFYIFAPRRGIVANAGKVARTKKTPEKNGAKKMTWMPIEWARRDSHAAVLSSDLSPGLRMASNVLRALFILCLLAITLRVSMPQSETIWTAYDAPGDLVRMVLGLAVCVWLVVQLFTASMDARHHRTWLYLGLAAVPFALICLITVW